MHMCFSELHLEHLFRTWGVNAMQHNVIERGILGLDLISAQAWRGTQTNSQNSSGGVSRETEGQKTRKLA